MLMEKASKVNALIVLPEGTEDRILKAARIITKQKIAKIVLLGKEEDIQEKGKSLSLDLSEIAIIDPKKFPELERYSRELYERRKHRGVTLEDARNLILNPLYFGAIMVALGDAHGMVVGAVTKTSDVMRTALQVIPKGENVKLVHRFANAEVIGPITQGLSKPINNLSRGSSISDIINSILVTILQSTSKPIIPTKEIEE